MKLEKEGKHECLGESEASVCGKLVCQSLPPAREEPSQRPKVVGLNDRRTSVLTHNAGLSEES